MPRNLPTFALITTAPIAAAFALATLSGCDRSHDGHSHADGDHAHDEPGGHDDMAFKLTPIILGERTVIVELPTALVAEAMVHAHFTVEGDPSEVVRAWVGLESGEGSMKSRGAGSGPAYHIDLEVPSELTPEMAVWVELENGGETEIGSTAIPTAIE